jgi:hypothetical protein
VGALVCSKVVWGGVLGGYIRGGGWGLWG